MGSGFIQCLTKDGGGGGSWARSQAGISIHHKWSQWRAFFCVEEGVKKKSGERQAGEKKSKTLSLSLSLSLVNSDAVVAARRVFSALTGSQTHTPLVENRHGAAWMHCVCECLFVCVCVSV